MRYLNCTELEFNILIHNWKVGIHNYLADVHRLERNKYRKLTCKMYPMIPDDCFPVFSEQQRLVTIKNFNDAKPIVFRGNESFSEFNDSWNKQLNQNSCKPLIYGTP